MSAVARLLIVDDNKVNRLLLSRSVEMLGYDAAVAENGRRLSRHNARVCAGFCLKRTRHTLTARAVF